MKNKGGRPKEWDCERISNTIKLMEKYSENTAIPILAEFCYINDLPREYLYQLKEFTYPIKKMMLKKETQLEKLALSGKAPTAMCIFSLKQLGWSDKKEIEHSTIDENGEKTGVLQRLSEAYDKAGKNSNI